MTKVSKLLLMFVICGGRFFEEPPKPFVRTQSRPQRITKNDAHTIRAKIVTKSYPRYRGNAV